MSDVKSMKPTQSLSSLVGKPIIYTNKDDILDANEKWKANRVKEYNNSIKQYQKSLMKFESDYIELSAANPDDPRLEGIRKAILDLKRRLIKFNQMVLDYEKTDW